MEERTSICVRQVLSEPLTRSVTGAVTSILYKSTKAIPLPLFLRVRASANMSIF